MSKFFPLRFCFGVVAMLLIAPFTSAEDAMTPPTTAQSSDLFPTAMYQALVREKPAENLFFSPFSLVNVLSMTAEGARQQTAAEMGQVLNAKPVPGNDAHPFDYSDVRSTIAQLSKRLTESKDVSSQFSTANALWCEKTFSLQPSYLDLIVKSYSPAGLFPVDFRGNPEAARVEINHWVSHKTHDRINDLLAPGQVTPDVRMVLTNAVYFLGKWADPFLPSATESQDFHAIDGKAMTVSLMHNYSISEARYAAFNGDGSLFATPDFTDRSTDKLYPPADGFQLAELSYKQSDLRMIILLPQRAGDGLSNLEKTLTSHALATWMDQLKPRRMNLFLPKFKLEESYNCIPTLQKLGMKRAFINPITGEGAQFEAIGTSRDPAEQLYIGFVVQKAFVAVDEQGTEAAAASGVGMVALGMRRVEPFTPTVRADHPFLFLIVDHASGQIIFIGRYVKPTS